MTCIVGVRDNSGVWIGADSCGSDGTTRAIISSPKVFRVGELLIGCTTSYRYIDLLQYSMVVAPLHDGDIDRYLRTAVIPAMRQTLKDGGAMGNTDQREDGGTCLIGIKDRLYKIGDDFGVMQHDDIAVGSGYLVALGSLHTSRGHHPHARVSRALQAAQYVTAFVAGPFVINTTQQNQE